MQKWFPDRVPKIGGYHERHYSGFDGKGPEATMCAQTPESASVQSHLSSLRIRQKGRRLTVDSEIRWYSRERTGDVVYRTVFRLDGDAVVLLSNKVVHRSKLDSADDEVQSP